MTDYVTQDQLEQRLTEHSQTLDIRTQARIDGAIAASTAAQEQRWNAFQTQVRDDITLTVENAVGRVVGRLEERVYQIEREGQDLAADVRDLRHTIHGDPDERSGHPSIFEMFKSIEASIQALTSQIDLHDNRLDHLEGIEKAAVDFVRWVGKAAHKLVTARLTQFITTAVMLTVKLIPLLIGAIASAVAAASFFMTYLFRIYQ